MQFLRIATASLALALATGCVPDPLDGFADTGPSNVNPNSNTTDMGPTDTGGGGGGTFTPEFLAVAQIMRANCLLGGCHGNPPGAAQYFLVPTGVNATDAEIQAGFQNPSPTSSGNRLITAGNPNTSEIYVRITKPAGDIQLMGAATYGATATPLMAADITTIGNWITNGAVYTQ